ncbi:tyrosine-type recombinase/integrase [Cohnella sp. AR92]|uniref:tyrosine-type recombinase/integrase n=1 Tax=Cohnella sp. AR92 TaxID=648716 RepID=UPI000F8E8152|nr:tyrosine-type recombinase/integrase [Cohnella sp. AR92]RUS42059.1 site-specific integrase [Cohnella sp. AR92]
MAYIRKRGKTWSYTVSTGKDPVTGERRQDTKTGFRTKREAELAAAEVEMSVAKGTFIKEQNISFRQFSDKWMKWYTAGVISKKPKVSSIRQREYQIATLLTYFDAITMSDINRNQYQEALIDMSQKMQRNTVQGVHGTARMIFRKALQDGVVKIDPTEYTKVPSNEEEELALPKYMEKEQLAEFLSLAKHRGMDNDYAMFLTLAYTGMRVGELCVLKWKDIDTVNHTISINGTLFNPEDLSNWYEILTPKTRTSRRTIDVEPMVIEELEKLRARQNEFKMRYRKTYHDADFVFGRMDDPRRNHETYFGYPPKRRTIELRMDRITQWMNLPARLTPHSLRHTHTSLCAEAGIDIEVIMQRLGHKNDSMTRMVYLHVTKSMKKEASAKFGALMSSVVKL